ncbi:LGFP repeat-containing protein [Streptomyces griseoaurantiacus]|uniref:LGFP repeat-containing protein n=1 Tax=Streptomyces griseoaurantiacus TaxID=68213 RepID=UPI0032437D6B
MPDVIGAIRDKWAQLGADHGLLGQPLDIERPTFDGVGRAQEFSGGTVSWHPQIGAFAVWGAIRQKWMSIGREQYGYPLNDESPCPDGRGRFNHFRAMQLEGTPEASIYWTPQTGAEPVYGGIREFWASHGWENSQVGYPLEGEHDRIGRPGRVQRFERGLIVWTPQAGASFGALSDGNVLTFDTGMLTTANGLPLSGSAHLVITRSGDFTFTRHAHDAGFDNIDYVLETVLMAPTGMAFTFTHEGHVEGTVAGLPFGTPDRNDDHIQPGNNPALANQFEDLADAVFLGHVEGKDTLVGGVEKFIGDTVSEAATSLGKAAAAGVVALLV